MCADGSDSIRAQRSGHDAPQRGPIVHNGAVDDASFTPVGDGELPAVRGWWDAEAGGYYAEHGRDLGDADLLWCPEGVRESEAHLLGEVRALRVLEVGCGAAQGARWTMAAGAQVVGLDSSAGMLAVGRTLNERTGLAVPLVQGDARALPFGEATFDLAFTAFGALAFLPDLGEVHREVARVLRPHGRWVFSALHPMRWCFPDDPAVDSYALTVQRSYFDPTPYTERRGGRLEYAEFPHTLSEHINSLVDAGFVVERVLEPQPVPGQAVRWGAWSPERGAFLPGTVIVAARLSGPPPPTCGPPPRTRRAEPTD
jgi:ubiquinone/menaquinone biosynthesis C-methylase UbiE